MLLFMPVSKQGEFVSCLLSLLRQMTDRHYQQLLDSFNTKEDLRVSNRNVYLLVHISIRSNNFPN